VHGEDVRRKTSSHHSTRWKRAPDSDPPDRRDESCAARSTSLVVYTLLSQESRNRGSRLPTPRSTRRWEAEVAVPTQDAFDKALKERGMTVDSLRKDARVDLSVTKLMESETARCRARAISRRRTSTRKNPDRFQAGRIGPRQPTSWSASTRRRTPRPKRKRAPRSTRPEAGEGGRRFRQARTATLAGRERRPGRRSQITSRRARWSRPSTSRLRA